MHDAASNGHLEVVQLLLHKGAIPSLKNDLGETPLKILQKWRTKTILTKDEEVLYKNICNKIHNLIDKTNASEVLNRSKSRTPVKPTRNETPPSTSKTPSKIRELHSPVFKKRNVIDDDSDDEMNLSQNPRNQIAFPSDDSNSNDSSDDCKTTTDKEVSGVKEYRNVISALRNRVASANDSPEKDVKKSKPRSALLDANEVDDDWLEDDMGVNKNKKRKLSDPLTVVAAKKPSYDSVKESIASINKITEPLIDSNINTYKSYEKQKKRTSDLIDISENSSESEHFQRNENICPFKDSRNAARELDDSKLKDSREGMRRRWKRQSTLLKAGFQRNREDCDQSSGSECESSTRTASKRLTPTGTFSRHSSGENFTNFSPRKQNEGFNVIQNMNPSVMQPLNVIQPINIVQSSRNGRPMQTQILPPAAVKVQVEDKVLLISLKLDAINKLTISWLVDEVKTRYYKYVGSCIQVQIINNRIVLKVFI